MRTKLLLTFVLSLGAFSDVFGSSPQKIEMRSLDASSIISEVKKSKAKVKVVNLWASWCAPCIKELPDFAKAETKLKDVEFFYVSGDDDKDLATAEKFIENAGVKGTKFRLNPVNEQAFRAFSPSWSGSLPTTFIYYGESVSDQTSKPLDEKRLLEWVNFRLKHPPRKSLIDKPSSPKVKSSQGRIMNNQIEFESKKTNPDITSVQDVVAEELDKKRSEVVLIDVRQPDEFTGELSHIPGATLIPLGTLPEKLSQLSKDKTIVFVCRSGGRSARAAALASENGFTSVYNLKGGMLRWNELHLPVQGATESTKK